MTAVKETPRPISQHRPSFSSNAASSLPSRQSYSRSHSHLPPGASLNPAHRVTRRKSTTLNPATSAAAISAAVNIANESDFDGRRAANRRVPTSRAVLGSLNSGSYPSPPSSLQHHPSVPSSMHYGRNNASSSSALVDGPPLSSLNDKNNAKDRVRRASEGSSLKKAANGELKCETCGKGYKHSSCLTKHLWEHTPEWSITSKLLISKHQQVQLLEAASVLVAMNNDAPDTAKVSDSDQSSASPAASGSSDLREDDLSSAETTPPPQGEVAFGHRKHDSYTSSAFSRSYQSGLSSSAGTAMQHGDYHDHRHYSSSNHRPTTTGSTLAESYPDEDQADLAAAVGLLSCSYGTPQTGPSGFPSDVPPVPPLPARYQSHQQAASIPKARQPSEDIDVDMDVDEDSSFEDEGRQHASAKVDDDDGVFGNMEE